jgi:hypothetical protein
MAIEVRIDDRVTTTLRELARNERRPIEEIVRDALELYQKEQFWQAVEQSLARLRADPVAWQDYEDEIRLLEGGSMDGLEDAHPYFSDTELEEILGSTSSR